MIPVLASKFTPYDDVLKQRAKDGSYPAILHKPSGSVSLPDPFTSALVQYHLDQLGCRDAKPTIDFCVSFESPTLPGTFTYQKDGSMPSDTDCTAVILMMLLRHGLAQPRQISKIIDGPMKPVCVSDGIYATWMGVSPTGKQDIDPVVNVNMSVLLKAVGRPINNTIAWASRVIGQAKSPNDAAKLSAWYSSPQEILFALDRAIQQGVNEWSQLRQVISGYAWGQPELSDSHKIYRGLNPADYVTCRALQRVRRIVYQR